MVKFLSLSLSLLVFFCQPGFADSYSMKLDAALRVDSRTDRNDELQYRTRIYPGYEFNEHLSLNAFAVSGTSFSSSYQEFGEDEGPIARLRRLYIRWQSGEEKTELGLIPPYKGAISSTGLSSHGWIKGLRNVQSVSEDTLLEVVVGELSDIFEPNAFNAVNKVNYFELEYSSRKSDLFSYEFSVERMLGSNFLRSEVRQEMNSGTSYGFEIVVNTTESSLKTVLSAGRQLEILGQSSEAVLYYSYIAPEFGQRAQLIEDFFGFGHSLAVDIEGDLQYLDDLGWFINLERNENRSRVQFGLKFSIFSV